MSRDKVSYTKGQILLGSLISGYSYVITYVIYYAWSHFLITSSLEVLLQLPMKLKLLILCWSARRVVTKLISKYQHTIFTLIFYFQYAHLENAKGMVVDVTNVQLARYRQFVEDLRKIVQVRERNETTGCKIELYRVPSNYPTAEYSVSISVPDLYSTVLAFLPGPYPASRHRLFTMLTKK